MQTVNDGVVKYYLPVGEKQVFMNELLGRTIKMTFLDKIYCIGCGRLTKKSYAQGYCYPCLLHSPETSECIIHPEKCRAHEGISRDMQWSREHCLKDHIVYLADTTAVKVGVTRVSQVPVRWMDQGATHAIKIARTPNRFLAGEIEVELKAHFSDKTNWRNMLVNNSSSETNLLEEKKRIREKFPESHREYFIDEDEITHITYPVEDFPKKVTSLSFDKTPEISGLLSGIKGQYLIFADGRVLNIRKHNGYKMDFSIKN